MIKKETNEIKENIKYLTELIEEVYDEEIKIEIRNQIKHELFLLKTRIFTDLGELKNE
ncbi:hypothetical protein [Spiroplasma endosymbiont of Amphimallon solstitiale]|uniref:hypothetical protein n=1 Tax=Spiroplasma endosymbiont of Amphimallon solstitiale TaxID=3066288 RepID=UPI00313BDB4B